MKDAADVDDDDIEVQCEIDKIFILDHQFALE
jgi:hypothetical protein